MGIRACLIALVILYPSLVNAQPSATADGARALIRGGTHTAIRVLTPLAEAASPDPLAQFFLGMAYQSLPGIENKAFACQLFKRASVAANPLAPQAEAMAASFQRPGPLAVRLCDSTTEPPAGLAPAATTAIGKPESPIDDGGRGVEADAMRNAAWQSMSRGRFLPEVQHARLDDHPSFRGSLGFAPDPADGAC